MCDPARAAFSFGTPPAAPTGVTSDARVLICTALPSLGGLVRNALEPDGHALHAVTSAATLTTALESAWAAEAPYRVLVTQALLPDGSAFDVLRALRKGGIRPLTVILTAESSQDVYYEAYRLQCMCVLALPVDPNELRRIVSLLVREPRG